MESLSLLSSSLKNQPPKLIVGYCEMIGLWPMTGQMTFSILAPWFDKKTTKLGSDKALVVLTVGDGRITTPYIQK